jgi:hypothetical protein
MTRKYILPILIDLVFGNLIFSANGDIDHRMVGLNVFVKNIYYGWSIVPPEVGDKSRAYHGACVDNPTRGGKFIRGR